jgi:hypothetical protein
MAWAAAWLILASMIAKMSFRIMAHLFAQRQFSRLGLLVV